MISASTEDEPILTFTRFTRRWFQLFAKGAFADAASQLDEPNSYGERWSSMKIQEVLREYLRSEVVRVSDPDTIPGGGRPNLTEFSDGRGYSFQHDVPLDGKWSDLTAEFEFLRRPTGYAVILHDIHVL